MHWCCGVIMLSLPGEDGRNRMAPENERNKIIQTSVSHEGMFIRRHVAHITFDTPAHSVYCDEPHPHQHAKSYCTWLHVVASYYGLNISNDLRKNCAEACSNKTTSFSSKLQSLVSQPCGAEAGHRHTVFRLTKG